MLHPSLVASGMSDTRKRANEDMEVIDKRRCTQISYSRLSEGHPALEPAEQHARVPTSVPSPPRAKLTRFPVHPSTPSFLSKRKIPDTTAQTLDLSSEAAVWKAFPPHFKQRTSTICHGKRHGRPHVAIDERKATSDNRKAFLRQITHENVVHLLQFTWTSQKLFLVYEYMNVSLRDVATYASSLKYLEIGQVCQAVRSKMPSQSHRLRVR